MSFEGDNAARMVNNYDWTKDLTAIELLRDIGKHYRLGTMLAKDTVARRLNSDEGISYTEFSYQLLQGMDFLELYRRYGCTLQTGGSDQWGNLTSGTELTRKAEGTTVHALATPLITKADGTKFGKTESGHRVARPGPDQPVRVLPVLAQRGRCGRHELPQVVHLPFARRDRTARAAVADEPFKREAQRTLA